MRLHTIGDNVYVGSTIETLGQIMTKHRNNMTTHPHSKLYEHIYELGVDNFYIELIEHSPCNDMYELRAREGHCIREKETLNKHIAGRTHKQLVQDNK